MKYRATMCGMVVGPRGYPLKMVSKANGYLHFSQSDGTGRPNQRTAHRFIYEHFKGLIPEGLVIDHIDGDRHNNKITNLRAITQRENCLAGRHAILTQDQVAEIRNLIGTTTGRKIADMFNVSEQLISDIKHNRRH